MREDNLCLLVVDHLICETKILSRVCRACVGHSLHLNECVLERTPRFVRPPGAVRHWKTIKLAVAQSKRATQEHHNC